MKILAIGNSFSVDAMQWVYEIARDCGIHSLTLGNLYIGGCSLERHYNNTQSGAADYIYYKNTQGVWEAKEHCTILDGIQDENWDMITMQQASGLSGMSESYAPYLDRLIAYVKQHRKNPNAELAWHMTWAYQQGADHPDFSNYHSSQKMMYQAIVQAVQSEILTKSDFQTIIPVGTAIQNLRSSSIGDTLTRDGYHLQYNLGRYIAAMTWVKQLLRMPIDDVRFVPDVREIPDEVLKIVKKAVNLAVEHPFTVQTEERMA